VLLQGAQSGNGGSVPRESALFRTAPRPTTRGIPTAGAHDSKMERWCVVQLRPRMLSV
jgi:hypothetical protein